MNDSIRLPSRVAFAIRHFGLDQKRVLDVGCGEGSHMAHFGSRSVGLELREHAVTVARSRGLDVRQWDITAGLPPDLTGAFEVVWCSNILEHVVSQHMFLLDARTALRPYGLFLAVVPMTRWFAAGPWRGFLAADHVGFFSPRTLRLTVERAGFGVEFIGSSSMPQLPRRVASALRTIAPNVLVAARRIEGFEYPEKAHKRLVNDRAVFKT